MHPIEAKFLSLLRFSVNPEAQEPEDIGSEDWFILHALAQKHCVEGVLLCGIERLSRERQPKGGDLFAFVGDKMRYRARNVRLNNAAVEVCLHFEKKRIGCCVLKGQGNNLYYPDKFARCPGDIDLWLQVDDKAFVLGVLRQNRRAEFYYHHVELPPYKGVEVEAHYRPMFMFNYWSNRRLQRFFQESQPQMCAHKVALPEEAGEIAVPTVAFNLVYQLSHIANHVLHEGIGLRQITDYYMLHIQPLSEGERRQTVRIISRCGLMPFLGAVTYVLQRVYGLPERLCLVRGNSRTGGFLLREMLLSGNFGHYDKRLPKNLRQSHLVSNLVRLRRDLRMLSYFPKECLSEPFFRLWHYLWRRNLLRKI